jgi:peptidoglycan pentaglycine glycine transferase (the first glycine)
MSNGGGRLTWTSRLSDVDARDYDAFVERAPGGHFAQSRRWSPIACAGRPFAASWVIVREPPGMVVGVAQVLRARIAGLALPYATIERGPVVADPARFAGVLRAIARAARRRGIARLAVMPYWETTTGTAETTEVAGAAGTRVQEALDARGWRSIQTAAGAHAATLRLELAGRSADQIFAGGAHKKLRQEIRAAARAGAIARRGSAEDLPRLVALYRRLMAEQGLHAKSAAWFGALSALDFGAAGSVGLFFTEQAGNILAAVLTIRHGHLVTLVLAASARAAQAADHKIARMVPCLVAAIEWARGLGCDFDLGGVPLAGDTDPKRLAIAQFKRDFARRQVELVGQHARWLIRAV